MNALWCVVVEDERFFFPPANLCCTGWVCVGNDGIGGHTSVLLYSGLVFL